MLESREGMGTRGNEAKCARAVEVWQTFRRRCIDVLKMSTGAIDGC
jgi:hypothetical protein